ncbi:dTDP-4-dehydrorhamnose reductase [Pasteurellaceae bacterium 20609_3]|uniref:dTDP-4-dehydrorhamnose reductase n=1 Tax=Spirabiliibacterium mucosae TaxID=28156 RepID=UPI001AACA5DB|nr:dTDP-4-dehydrorhamnose reductase [Spirabiliibacterium mucosae]
MAKILITGSKGQVGTCLCERLNGQATILAVDRSELDITERNSVLAIVDSFNPDIIINAAAYTAVDKAEIEQEIAEKINRDGPRNLAEAAELRNVPLLHISTDYVFDGKTADIYTEESQVNPQSVYGRTKLAGELASFEKCSKVIILRTAWVFSEHGNNFVKTMLRLASQNETLKVVGDQCGGPTYAGDIADALIKISNLIVNKQHVEYGIYNFTGKPYVSWYEFAQAIIEDGFSEGILSKKPIIQKIKTTEYPTLAVRPLNSRLELNKIYRNFEIEPSNWNKSLKYVIRKIKQL